MKRKCTCDRVWSTKFEHEDGQCWRCWLWYNSTPHRVKVWGGPSDIPSLPNGEPVRQIKIKPLDQKKSTPLRCKFRSEDPISTEETAKLELSVIRKWYQCSKNLQLRDKVPVGIVCSCIGCGPKCKEYIADEDDD